MHQWKKPEIMKKMISNRHLRFPRFLLQNLAPELRIACENAGWQSLTPVQAKSIPYILAGRDMMVQSRNRQRQDGRLYSADHAEN